MRAETYIHTNAIRKAERGRERRCEENMGKGESGPRTHTHTHTRSTRNHARKTHATREQRSRAKLRVHIVMWGWAAL